MKLLLSIGLFLAVLQLAAQNDMIATKNGDLQISPVLHSTVVFQWDDKTIYVDPYGGKELFSNFALPDLVLITDIHGDHLNHETLAQLDLKNAELVAPKAVIDQLGELKFKKTTRLNNAEETDWESIKIKAIPMYNLPETEDSRHPKGRGNGYVITIGGKNIYIPGDTEDIPEMRNLSNIDVAFMCMNMPYTMDINQAADAVLAFQPAIVYPFHFRGGGGKFSDVEQFKKLVEQGNRSIEVRIRNWYPK